MTSPHPSRFTSRLSHAAITLMAPCLALISAFVFPSTAWAETPVEACQRQGGIYLYLSEHQQLFAEGCTSSQGTTAADRINQISSAVLLPTGWLCQIDGRPDRCDAPTPNTWTYWTFWWAQGTDYWVYAEVGASYAGIPGTVEAWNYGDGWDELPPVPAPPLYDPSTAAPAAPAADAPVDAGQPAANAPAAQPGTDSGSNTQAGSTSDTRTQAAGGSAETLTAQTDSSSIPSASGSSSASSSASSDPSASPSPSSTPSSTPTPSRGAVATEEGQSIWSTVAVVVLLGGAIIGYGTYAFVTHKKTLKT